MGYTTDFRGEMTFDKPLTDAQTQYIRAFCDTRRVKRNAQKLAKLIKDGTVKEFPARAELGLPLGKQGGYFVIDDGQMGQGEDLSVTDGNNPPEGQPGLWCKWTVRENGKILEWSGVEKFYDYVEWLDYLVKHFFTPWGRKLTGTIRWQGEESEDRGVITATDGVITSLSLQEPETLAHAVLWVRYYLNLCHSLMNDMPTMEGGSGHAAAEAILSLQPDIQNIQKLSLQPLTVPKNFTKVRNKARAVSKAP